MAKELIVGELAQAGVKYEAKIEDGKLKLAIEVDLVKDIDAIPGASSFEDMVKGLAKAAILAL